MYTVHANKGALDNGANYTDLTFELPSICLIYYFSFDLRFADLYLVKWRRRGGGLQILISSVAYRVDGGGGVFPFFPSISIK